MKIGITMRVVDETRYAERRDALAHDWYRFLDAVAPGLESVLLPNIGESVVDYARTLKLDGLILSGGNDIGAVPVRDTTERALIGHFMDEGKPILGICRGLQLLHSYHGGKLNQCTPGRHANTRHVVTIQHDMAFGIVRGTELTVNSYHDNCLETHLYPDSGLVPFALDQDGLVEGVVDTQRKIAAIMWHPEREPDISDFDRKLFHWLFS